MRKHNVLWSQSPSLRALVSNLAVAVSSIGASIECLVEEAVKVGEGVEGLVEEPGERHLGECN